MKLLSKNPKVEKGEKAGYLTYILHLAPADLSGYQVCPMAELAGCKNLALTRQAVAESSRWERIAIPYNVQG